MLGIWSLTPGLSGLGLAAGVALSAHGAVLAANTRHQATSGGGSV